MDKNYTEKDKEIILSLKKGEDLPSIVKRLFPETKEESSFDIFYKQSNIQLGDIIRSHFGINRKDTHYGR